MGPLMGRRSSCEIDPEQFVVGVFPSHSGLPAVMTL